MFKLLFLWATITCPFGYVQVGELGANIKGCGINENCMDRRKFDNIGKCESWCASNTNCHAFTFSPPHSPTEPMICTLYTHNEPNSILGIYQIFCRRGKLF